MATTYRGRPVDVVLDVRSRLERLLGRVPGSICIPLHDLERALPQAEGITKQSRIVVYCASGARSRSAVALMQRMGYRNAIDGGPLPTVMRELARTAS